MSQQSNAASKSGARKYVKCAECDRKCSVRKLEDGICDRCWSDLSASLTAEAQSAPPCPHCGSDATSGMRDGVCVECADAESGPPTAECTEEDITPTAQPSKPVAVAQSAPAVKAPVAQSSNGQSGVSEYMRLAQLCRDAGLPDGGTEDSLRKRLSAKGTNIPTAAPVATVATESATAKYMRLSAECRQLGLPDGGTVDALERRIAIQRSGKSAPVLPVATPAVSKPVATPATLDQDEQTVVNAPIGTLAFATPALVGAKGAIVLSAATPVVPIPGTERKPATVIANPVPLSAITKSAPNAPTAAMGTVEERIATLERRMRDMSGRVGDMEADVSSIKPVLSQLSLVLSQLSERMDAERQLPAPVPYATLPAPAAPIATAERSKGYAGSADKRTIAAPGSAMYAECVETEVIPVATLADRFDDMSTSQLVTECVHSGIIPTTLDAETLRSLLRSKPAQSKPVAQSAPRTGKGASLLSGWTELPNGSAQRIIKGVCWTVTRVPASRSESMNEKNFADLFRDGIRVGTDFRTRSMRIAEQIAATGCSFADAKSVCKANS